MTTSLPVLSDVVDAFMAQLGIVEWHPEPGMDLCGYYWLVVRFECSVCRKRWLVSIASGPPDEVIHDLFAKHDAHRCDLELGGAGR